MTSPPTRDRSEELASDPSALVSKARLQVLARRTNVHASARLLVHLALLGASSVLLHRATEASGAWLVPAMLGHGVLLATFFGPLHECAHRTAFRSVLLNDAVAWLSGLILLLPGLHYREFHFEHHRYTQDPRRDPELAVRPREWPSSWRQLLRLQVRYLFVPALRLVAMVRLACAPRSLRAFVRQRNRATVQIENALDLILYASLIALAIATGHGVLVVVWLASYSVAWLTFLWHIQCEHTGCATAGTQLARTRTMRSNAIWRFLLWNETYHGAHHAYPAIPFHALPALDREIGARHVNLVNGYLGLHLRVLRRLVRRA